MSKKNKLIFQEELEARIVHGLACEWETALGLLDREHHLHIRMPLIRLSDMKQKLGYWSESKREICLSRDFVLNHTWDSVKDVLLHEMAHQLAIETLNADEEPAHGPTFLKACYFLRANPKASGSYKTLHEQVEKNTFRPEDKLMLRIKKLMALAESPNQYEADAAMAKSRALIKKYNVNLLKTNQKREYKSIFLGSPLLRHFREEYHLANLIIDYYFVQGVWISAYVLNRGRMGKVLEISGISKNLKIASYVYDFIRYYIDSEWREYKKGTAYNRYHKTDFSIGIIEGFRQKLDDQEQNSPVSESRDLVVVKDFMLQEYFDYKYPHIKCFSRSASSHHEEIFADGMTMGRKMVISKGVSESSQSDIFLLEEITVTPKTGRSPHG